MLLRSNHNTAFSNRALYQESLSASGAWTTAMMDEVMPGPRFQVVLFFLSLRAFVQFSANCVRTTCRRKMKPTKGPSGRNSSHFNAGFILFRLTVSLVGAQG